MKLKKLYFALPFVVIIGLAIIGYGLLQLSNSRSFQLFGTLVSHVDTNKKVVALTFDDAPTEHTTVVLQTLKEKKVPATFFVIGSNIEKHPEIARSIVQAGHQVGNHSYSHKRFLLKQQSFIDEEIQKTNQLIRDSGYNDEIYFRPPNGKKLIGLPWYLSQHNITTIMWDVEPDTYAPNNLQGTARTDFLAQFAIEHTKPGSIILLHPFCDECGSDREAVGEIIDALQEKGYTFVTVSELLKYQQQ